MRQEAHQAVLEERLERRLDAALRMLITALLTRLVGNLVACLAGLMRTLLVGTLHGVALPAGATDAPAVPAVEPSAVPGVVEASAVEEIQLVVEAFDDVEEQAEQCVRVTGIQQASGVGVEVAGVDATCVAEAEQRDLRECVGEGSESDVLRVGGQRQAAEVYQGHVGVPGVRLLRLEQRRHGIMSDGEMHGIVRKPAAPCEHLVDGTRRPGRGMHLEVARLIILMEVRAEAIEEL
ncbi:CASP8-associated 2, putative [Babesia ovata]|uniref:CASP8-associated 2, putative n=1 Tax=Babesia ovata TaxID=189622 RepID=A0A2H6KJ02_9APIC|nr:CASP8-associated 2, putative [Babesia ovata]GBE62968.1 CASP8-associated 2, putative [Babesia ovata]